MNLLAHISILATLINIVLNAKILGIFHTFMYSHIKLGNTLLYELAARGHEVVAILPGSNVSQTPIKNLKEIKLETFYFFDGNLSDIYREEERGIVDKILVMDIAGIDHAKNFFEQTSVQNLLKSNETFDLIIMEQFFNEAFLGFCYHYQTPCVVLGTTGPSRWTDLQVGNPINPSYMSDMYLNYPSKMNFNERLINTFTFILAMCNFHLLTLPKQNELLQKNFPGAPHITELYYNISLLLVNSHVSFTSAIPTVPNMIEIGGFHVSPPKSLSKDLQDYLDSAKDGVIYFSMGSVLESKDMDEARRNAILKVFSKLKQKVLWKWENQSLPNQPANVKIEKWIPQQDVLAHHNIKLFINHGGLLSIIEAIYHGIPIVGIPIFGDQKRNVRVAENGGYGKGVVYSTLSEESFGNAVSEVLNNPKYMENAKLRSKTMHDQPMKPLDTVMYWIEYVLRHKGAPHLRTSALSLRWFQVYCLDIIAFIVVLIYIVGFSTFRIIKLVCRRRPKEFQLSSETKKKN